MSAEQYSLDTIESWCDETIPEDRAVLALVAAVRAAKAVVPKMRHPLSCAWGECSACTADIALARFRE